MYSRMYSINKSLHARALPGRAAHVLQPRYHVRHAHAAGVDVLTKLGHGPLLDALADPRVEPARELHAARHARRAGRAVEPVRRVLLHLDDLRVVQVPRVRMQRLVARVHARVLQDPRLRDAAQERTHPPWQPARLLDQPRAAELPVRVHLARKRVDRQHVRRVGVRVPVEKRQRHRAKVLVIAVRVLVPEYHLRLRVCVTPEHCK